MLQRWHEISFFHWSCDPALLQPRLPPGLRIDTYDGKAWISLTPFLLKGLRPPLFPPTLGLTFPEMNLRTYAVGTKGPGIWFFSPAGGAHHRRSRRSRFVRPAVLLVGYASGYRSE